MKGLELPINTLIVMVIMVIVLIAAILFFYDPFKKSVASVDLTTARNNACNMLTGMGCPLLVTADSIPVNDFDANKDGSLNPGSGTSGDNLLELCKKYYSISVDDDCKTQICSCPS